MPLIQTACDFIRLNWHLYQTSSRQIARFQEKKVLDLLSYARKASPFYREAYGGIQVSSLAGYRLLPTINKTIMMQHFDTINTAGLKLDEVMAYAIAKELAGDYLGYYQSRYVVGLSSGTSGNKGIYITDKALTKRLPGVFLARGGVRLTDLPLRILFILRVFSQGFADINAPLIQLRYMPVMAEPELIVDTYNAMQANILMAPPSLLRQLIPLAGRLHSPPRRIITYAEVLEQEEKERLSRIFTTAVVEIYQASEGQIASPCRCGSLHINEDLVYVELLQADGRTPLTEPGQRSGMMLVTNLVNRSQPLLRYEMNDMIELGDPCPCGSHFRVISRIIGRQDDVLLLTSRNGKEKPLYPDLVSRWIITTDDRIREFYVEQDARDHLLIHIDSEQSGDADLVASLKQRLRDRLAAEMAKYDLACRVDIVAEPIRMPKENRKMKRFINTAGLKP